ncbi:MAG: hypothetical protein H7257_11115, partial [Taibaiella sp.]|nr:hypothetical protein [Taibaiella sp.]
MKSDTSLYNIENNGHFVISGVWIEHKWSYECDNGNLKIKPDTGLQLVVEGKLSGIDKEQ